MQEANWFTSIDLPAKGFTEHFTYIKLRDRTSYAFALVSVAVALEMADGQITEARIAMGALRTNHGASPK